MASRGGGRGCGRGQLTFNVEAVGIGKGDALPPPTLQPSPLFPVSVFPSFPRLPYALDWLYAILDSSWVIKIILIWSLSVSLLATYMGCFPD